MGGAHPGRPRQRPRPPWALAGLLGLVLLSLAACSSTKPPPNPFRGEVPASEQTIDIFVENQGFSDATVHAIAEGSRIRMGTVNGKQSRTFSISWPFMRELSVHISELAGDEFTTRRLVVSPGERVQLLIQQPIRRSYLVR